MTGFIRQRRSIYLMVARKKKKNNGGMKSGDGVINPLPKDSLSDSLSPLTRLRLISSPNGSMGWEKSLNAWTFLVHFLDFLSISYLSATQACVQYYLM